VTIAVTRYTGLNAALYVSPTIVGFDNYSQINIKDLSTGAVSRMWELSDGTTSEQSSWTYSYPTDYDSVEVLLTALCAIGCQDTAKTTIHFRPTTFYAASAFMPDERSGAPTNSNDISVFRIQGQNIIDLEVFIYDRRGLLVCQWEGADGYWDGTHDSKPLPQGTYVWVANFRTYDQPHNMQHRKGSVLLLR